MTFSKVRQWKGYHSLQEILTAGQILMPLYTMSYSSSLLYKQLIKQLTSIYLTTEFTENEDKCVCTCGAAHSKEKKRERERKS